MTLKETLDNTFPGWFTKNKQVAGLLNTEVTEIKEYPTFTKILLNKMQKFEKTSFPVSVTVNPDKRVCKNF